MFPLITLHRNRGRKKEKGEGEEIEDKVTEKKKEKNFNYKNSRQYIGIHRNSKSDKKSNIRRNIGRRGIIVKKKKKETESIVKKGRNRNDLFEFTECPGIQRDMCSKSENGSNVSSCVFSIWKYIRIIHTRSYHIHHHKILYHDSLS